MNLHVGAAIMKALCTVLHPRGHNLAIKKLQVKLLWSYVANDRTSSTNQLTFAATSSRASVAPLDRVHMGLEFRGAAGIANESDQSICQSRASASRHWHSAQLQSGGHHLVHE